MDDGDAKNALDPGHKSEAEVSSQIDDDVAREVGASR
jgi:hypothetical protein